MEKASGTKRTIGATIVLVIELLKQFGLDLQINQADIDSIIQAIGAGILAFGTIENWIKRIKIMISGSKK